MLYLRQMGKFVLLTPQEEKELAVRYRQRREEAAAERLITSNLRLVVKIAKRYLSYWRGNMLDLIQEGNTGLIMAVRRFDPDKGVKLSSYASFWIRAYILKFIMDNWRLVKIGTTRTERRLFFRLSRERERMVALGLEPRPDLIAANLDSTEEAVIEMIQRLGADELSLSPAEDEEGYASCANCLAHGGQSIEEALSTKQIVRILSRRIRIFRSLLSGREAEIFDRRIMSENPATLRELGAKYDISRERVRQIQAAMVAKLVRSLRNNIAELRKEPPLDALK
jgi:RNA polymerase sigma-32 factor